MSWLNEIIQPPPDPEANRWIQVSTWQVVICDGDTCAAAILAYFFARHYGKLKHVAEGREDNQIATAHGLKPRRAAESLWFRATDAQIEDAIFFYRRRKFAEAIAKLEALQFVSILKKNPNPNFAGDNSRYFRLNPDAVQAKLRTVYDYKTAVSPAVASLRKNADTPPKPKSSVRKNADTSGKNAGSTRENAESLYKERNKEGTKEGSAPVGASEVESKNDSTSVSKERKLQLKAILEGQAELPAVEGVAPDEALLEWLPVALDCSRAAQALFAFTYWKLHHGNLKAIFDARRKKAAEDRLKAGYTLDRLLLAIRGIKFSAHHMGLNPKSNPDNRIYTDFARHILKDGAAVETFEALAAESDEADRRHKAEAALRSDLPAVPDSKFNEAEIEDFATKVADKLAAGYYVEQLRTMYRVGKTLPVPDWTRILERAAAIKTDRESESLNGNGKAEVIRAGESEEFTAASEATAAAEGGVRQMPYARPEDFEE